MNATHPWQFLKSYLCDPTVVGAVTPSSRALSAALSEPFRRCSTPATVLEVGAGTGAITRHLGSVLGEHDRLDICEIQPEFVAILERDVLSQPDFIPAVEGGRVRILDTPVQDLDDQDRYDFIICGLPLTAFALRDVRKIFKALRRCLKPGGVLSYFEYIGMRRTWRTLAVGRKRTRIRTVSAYLSKHIRAHQFDRRTVLQNLPPAHARHLKFHS